MSHELFERCIRACQECSLECDHCAAACLKERDVAALAACIALNKECAGTCALAVRFMASGSSFARAFCELCARICDACAAECEKHDMEHCRKCAEACRRCATECRAMAPKSKAA
jgi:hypothetical protein